jgi:alanine racemase
MNFLRIFRNIRRRFGNYNPSVEILISRQRLLDNLGEYARQYPGLLLAPVLKSNAYGHGLIPVAEILDQAKIAFFVLDSLYEAMILRRAGIKSEILVIGYTPAENIKNARMARVSFTIASLEQLQEVAKIITAPLKIHLKIDTGMHRQGITPEQVDEAIKIIKVCKFFVLQGVCSHLADADNIDDVFTKAQLEKWEKITLIFKSNFSSIKYFHILATAGSVYGNQGIVNVLRLGLGLYGIDSSPQKKMNLQPVLQARSLVGSLKKISAGEAIGYNATYRTKTEAMIATIPAGYFEGVDRRLSKRGFFKIKDIFCPIVGRVSMNITSIDVTAVPEIKLNDELILISDNSNDKNSVQNIAKLAETIPWEILVHLPQHLRRTVFEKQ